MDDLSSKRFAVVEARLHRAIKNIAVLETQIKASDRANERGLKLQAAEYERRLGILDHEQRQRVERDATYVTDIVYTTVITQIRKDITDIREGIKDLDKYKERMLGIVFFVVPIISVIVSIVVSIVISKTFPN